MKYKFQQGEYLRVEGKMSHPTTDVFCVFEIAGAQVLDQTDPLWRGTREEKFATICGDSWCRGDCGLPAGVITSPEGIEHKIYGSMVACGGLVQRWRGHSGEKWTGTRLVIEPEHWDYLSRRIWL